MCGKAICRAEVAQFLTKGAKVGTGVPRESCRRSIGQPPRHGLPMRTPKFVPKIPWPGEVAPVPDTCAADEVVGAP